MEKPATQASGSVVTRRPDGGNSSALARSRRLTIDGNTHLIGDTICKDAARRSRRNSFTSKQHPAQACQTPGLVMSVWGSDTTDSDHFAPYFSQKHSHFDGDLGAMSHRIGVLSHRGKKPDYPNQDDFFVLARAESLLFGVLDGHGPDGHDISHFAQELLPGFFVERLRQGSLSWDQIVHGSFGELISHLQDELPDKAETSGSTVSVAMLDRDECGSFRLRGAFLGDSTVVHGWRTSPEGNWEVEHLTNIHRPDREDEHDRITAAGGKVQVPEAEGLAAKLITPAWMLSLSRAAGDFHAVPFGLSSHPELMAEVHFDEGCEHVILCCSDGIWDVLSPVQAVNFVTRFPPEDAQLAVERLVTKAQHRWQEAEDVVDDITAILIWPGLGNATSSGQE